MLNPADDRLARMLPEGVLRPVRPADLDEPRGRWQGRAGLVAAPRSARLVAQMLAGEPTEIDAKPFDPCRFE